MASGAVRAVDGYDSQPFAVIGITVDKNAAVEALLFGSAEKTQHSEIMAQAGDSCMMKSFPQRNTAQPKKF
jgi:hypothetical protein